MLNQYTDYIVILTKLHLTTVSFQGHEQNLQKENVVEGASPEGGALCIGTLLRGRGRGGEERKGGASNDGQTFN